MMCASKAATVPVISTAAGQWILCRRLFLQFFLRFDDKWSDIRESNVVVTNTPSLAQSTE